MAAWLAVLRVFRFRTPLSGDRTARQIMRRRQGSLAVPLWPRGRSSFPRITGPEFQVQPMHFRTLVLERLRLPLLLTEARCECGQNDIFGRHRAACPQTGRLKRRAVPARRTVCRKAGGTVTRHVKLRDMNVQVSAMDERGIEVVAAGLPIHHGAQGARTTAATVNGAALSQARRDKEAKYPELVATERFRLVVVAMETGGRWSTEALEFVADNGIFSKGCCQCGVPKHLRLRWSRVTPTFGQALMGRRPISPICAGGSRLPTQLTSVKKVGSREVQSSHLDCLSSEFARTSTEPVKFRSNDGHLLRQKKLFETTDGTKGKSPVLRRPARTAFSALFGRLLPLSKLPYKGKPGAVPTRVMIVLSTRAHKPRWDRVKLLPETIAMVFL